MSPSGPGPLPADGFTVTEWDELCPELFQGATSG